MDRVLFARRLVESLKRFGYVRRAERSILAPHPSPKVDGLFIVPCAEFYIGENQEELRVLRSYQIFSLPKTSHSNAVVPKLYKLLNDGLPENHVPARVFVPKGYYLKNPSVDELELEVHEETDFHTLWIQLFLSRETTCMNSKAWLPRSSLLP